MYFLKPKVTPIDEHDLQKKVEYAYRICYRSEHLMKDGSEKLISRLLHGEFHKITPEGEFTQHASSIKHTSPLAHAMIKIEIPLKLKDIIKENCHMRTALWNTAQFFLWDENPDDDRVVMTTNFRALFELLEDASSFGNDYGTTIHGEKILWLLAEALHEKYPCVFKHYEFDFLQTKDISSYDTDYDRDEKIVILGEPEQYKTFHIVTTRDVLQEIVRHTTLWPSVESTRYCNYAKKGLVFTLPYPYDTATDVDTEPVVDDFLRLTEDEENRQEMIQTIDELDRLDNFTDIYLQSCRLTELLYNRAIVIGAKPEQARMLLTGGVKTEFLMTGVWDAWTHFIDLRNAKDAHPQIRIIAQDVKNYFDSYAWVK